MTTEKNMPENTAVALRTRLRQQRAELPEGQRSRGALLMRGRLYTWLNLAREAAVAAGRPAPTTVAAFWPMPDEPDLRPLLSQWAEAHMTVTLPVVRERNAPLAFLPWTPEAEMRAGPYGILEPVSGPDLVPDLILVPTLGYTAAGDRLGYGGGYYDRTLAALRDKGHAFTAIGIAWRCGELDAGYRPAPHDVPLDAILTEDGWALQPPSGTLGPSGAPLHAFRMN